MSLDPPARIAILGAGPIGLEAALYGRFLGYHVDVFERGADIAECVRKWGHVRMFTPFEMNASPLGVASIEAQDPTWRPPGGTDLLTGGEWFDQYLKPLSLTDLVADSIHRNTQVVAVGREGLLKLQTSSGRGDSPFRILTHSAEGAEHAWHADAVLDTTGTYASPNWLGPGGTPAIGERAAAQHIEYDLPDILGRDRERYAARHTLLIGSGYSAATTLLGLVELGKQVAGTRVTWLTRPPAGEEDAPIPVIPEDPLVARRLLAETANELVRDKRADLAHIAGGSIEQIDFSAPDGPFQVKLSSFEDSAIHVDRIVANVGYRPDVAIYRELHVHTSHITEGSASLAAALMQPADRNAVEPISGGHESLVHPEPNFFVLGAKSYGRDSRFLLPAGMGQIRQVFKLLSDNPQLDLYRSVRQR